MWRRSSRERMSLGGAEDGGVDDVVFCFLDVGAGVMAALFDGSHSGAATGAATARAGIDGAALGCRLRLFCLHLAFFFDFDSTKR